MVARRPCGDKGIGSYVVDSGQVKVSEEEVGNRQEVVEGRARSKSNTVGRSRLVSFRFMNGKSASALERAGGARMPTCESRSRQREPGSKSRHNEHEWGRCLAVISVDLTDAGTCTTIGADIRLRNRVQEGIDNDEAMR